MSAHLGKRHDCTHPPTIMQVRSGCASLPRTTPQKSWFHGTCPLTSLQLRRHDHGLIPTQSTRSQEAGTLTQTPRDTACTWPIPGSPKHVVTRTALGPISPLPGRTQRLPVGHSKLTAGVPTQHPAPHEVLGSVPYVTVLHPFFEFPNGAGLELTHGPSFLPGETPLSLPSSAQKSPCHTSPLPAL